jgi:hypothetical protein
MSSKLPILLAIAGVAYFISTASAEEGDDISGCMEVTACNYDSTATVDSGDCKYGDSCDDDDDPYFPPENPCDNINTEYKFREVYGSAGSFDSERYAIGDTDIWSIQKTKIGKVMVSQLDYIPGSQVDIEFAAAVYNKSKSRCGQTTYWKVDKRCDFAPTGGSTVGGDEGHLKFSVMIVPHGSTVPADQEMFNGDTKFIGYSNQDDVDIKREEDPDFDKPCKGKNNCKIFKNQEALYRLSLTIPSNTPSLGGYDIIIRTGLQSNWNSSMFRGKAVFPNAFNVEECETSSEAENYETRFMSNQSFMTL